MAAKAQPKTPVADIASELDNLAACRETLATRREKVVAELTAARSARKTALSKDPGAELAGLTRSVRDSEDELDTIEGVLSDLDEQLADAVARKTVAEDQDQRITSAQQLQSIAIKVDDAAADLEKALALVGTAYAALINAIPDTLAVVELDQSITMEGALPILQDGMRPARPNDLARAILAEGITRTCPGAMGISRDGNSWRMDLGRPVDLGTARPSYIVHDIHRVADAMTATQATTALISSRIRTRAEDIVSGKAPSHIEDRPTLTPRMKPIAIKTDVEIIATTDFKFTLEDGAERSVINKGSIRDVAPDVATMAIKRGVAIRTDTPAGATAVHAEEERAARRAAEMRNRGAGVVSMPMSRDHVDLGTIRKPAPIRINAGAA
jgi:hypothetical protein